ncbi:MAG TPA: hypothetical protein VMY42_02490 [Thermoguttaceae bacterium]|nr:hypothetical protein [Thermoguttaceae bacterium]
MRHMTALRTTIFFAAVFSSLLLSRQSALAAEEPSIGRGSTRTGPSC